MKVVITGVSGLTGRHVAADLMRHGHQVVGIDHVRDDSAAGDFTALDLCEVMHLADAMHGSDAVVHLARVPFPYTASGYDAKTRTWRKPDRTGDAEKFNRNVAMTYNVLSAAQGAGVRKMVIGSSFAIYGLYYPSRPLMPDYLPIDEAHPKRPDDPYGLTKLIGEDLADAAASASGMQVTSLRFPGISREDRQSVATRQNDPVARGIGGLWTYVDVRDASTACRLALECDLPGHEAFNVCAPATFMSVPTDGLIKKYVPGVTRVARSEATNWAGYATSKAERLLGFKACHFVET